MKFKFWIFAIIYISQLFSQEISLGQSSPDLQWLRKQTSTGEIIFPKNESNSLSQVEDFLNYYKNYVAQDYQAQDPSPFTLVIRPELAQPNGFVTLGPRRSEWFEFASIFPFATTLNWFQVLAIHEYRHVVQYDYFHQSTAKFFNILFGDLGKQVALFLGMRAWFMEGDAVWAETKYTDSGRGRSPRFLSRLKALVLSNQVPTYDQLIGGSLQNNYPDWYSYGYVLVSYGRKKYGNDFWKKVLDSIAVFPNPFRLYSQFEKHAGIPFSQFYDETMDDLKKQWIADIDSEPVKEYKESIHPIKLNNNIYFLESTLDSYWELKTENSQGQEKVISEIPFYRDLMNPTMGHKYFVFTQFLLNERYQFQNYSDLFVLNLETKKIKQISDGKRYFNPKINKKMEKMLVVEFDQHQKWNLAELNMLGVELKKISFDNKIIQQADYLNDDEIIAIFSMPEGSKQLEILDLNGVTKKILIPATKANIFNLDSDQQSNFVFESQTNGRFEIFAFTNMGQTLLKCTDSKIGSYYPSISNGEILYSRQTSNGFEIEKTQLENCREINKSLFENFNYLSENNPSDNLITMEQLKPISKDEINNSEAKVYSDFEKRAWIPHSWSLIGGRGFLNSFQANNYLGTTSMLFNLGNDPEEEKNYGNFIFGYHKYRTLFNITVEDRTRKIEYFNSTTTREWKEYSGEFSLIYPFIYSKNLTNIFANFEIEVGHLSTKDYQLNNVDQKRSKDYFKSSSGFDFLMSKSLNQRSIYSPWLFSFSLKTEKVEGYKELVNRNYHQSVLHIPSFSKHHLFKFTYDRETQDKNNGKYRFLPEAVEENQYVFSRGFDYEAVAAYEKFTANYIFPIVMPDYNIEKWLFIRRVFANLFYDTTKISDEDLNSYGMEFQFESTFFRTLPLSFGIRLLEKDDPTDGKETEGELFLATQVGI